jgi:tetratricopeptide (TPR) repeat protein
MLQGHFAQADAILRQAITLCPDSAKAHYFLGFNAKGQDDLDAARETLERGLKIENWAPAQSILGEVYRQLDDPLKAGQHFEAALADDPSNSETWYGLGLTYRRVENEKAALGAAEESLRHALTLDADDVWAHCYLGHLLNRQDRMPEARSR